MFDKIITVTPNPSIDTTIWLDKFIYDDPITVSREKNDAGGKGINVSRVLNFLSTDNIAIGIVGNKNSDILNDLLEEDRVKTDFCYIDGKIRENITAMLPDGKLLKMNRRGSAVNNDDINCLEKSIIVQLSGSKNALVHFGGSLPLGFSKDAYIKLILEIKRYAKVSIDCAVFKYADYQILKPYLIKPNFEEIADIFETDISLEEVCGYAKKLALECENVMVSLGEHGMIYVSGGESVHITAPQVEVKSTVGAGDSSVAGFISSVAAGKSVYQSAEFATACGTASVTTDGTACVTRELVEKYLKLCKSQKI